MMKDEIVEQVRKAREENAAKFNYDLKAERFRSSDGFVAGAGKRPWASIEEPVIVPAIESSTKLQEPFVFVVGADPKPEVPVRHSHGERTVAAAETHAPIAPALLK